MLDCLKRGHPEGHVEAITSKKLPASTNVSDVAYLGPPKTSTLTPTPVLPDCFIWLRNSVWNGLPGKLFGCTMLYITRWMIVSCVRLLSKLATTGGALTTDEEN